MFHYIQGPLAVLMPSAAVIDANGVGFKLTISGNTYQKIAPSAQSHATVKLFTHLSVREDDMELFGFADESEMDTFKLLITVSGVGPRAALSILSSFTPESFALAVCSEDKKAISRANNIGPKTAARIILELHDKIAAGTALPPVFEAITSTMPAMSAAAASGTKLSEAQEALVVLGYSRSEILAALQGVDTAAMDTEGIIRAALKRLM